MLKIINWIMYVLTIVCTIILGFIVIKMDILPFKYLTFVSLIILFLYLIFAFITIKSKNKLILFIQIILEIFIIIGTCFGSYTVKKTDKFLTSFKKIETETAEYYVVVKKENSYKDIYDLENKKIGTYINNDEHYSKALDNLDKAIKSEIIDYPDLFTAADKLKEGEIQGLLITSYHLDMVDDEKTDYKSSVKIIYTDGIVIERPVEEEPIVDKNEEENKESPEKPKVDKFANLPDSKDVLTVYISGIDTDGPINRVSRSDVNIIMTINTKTHEILMTHIPRDYYVQLHGTTGYKDKLTHAGIYGINKSITTIQDLLSMKIDYYVRINFDTVLKVVDAVGGVDVYSDVAFRLSSSKYIKKGMNHLNAEETLTYARERKKFSSGDRKRGEHQEDIIEAVIKKVSSSKVLLLNYFDILESLEGSFQTSVPDSLIKDFVKKQLDAMPSWSIKRINLDGKGKYDYTYSIPGTKVYVMIPNQDTIDNASRAIRGMRKGKTFSQLGIK